MLPATSRLVENICFILTLALLAGGVADGVVALVDAYVLRGGTDAPAWMNWLAFDSVLVAMTAGMCLLGIKNRSSNITSLFTITVLMLMSVQLILALYCLGTHREGRHFSGDEPLAKVYIGLGVGVYSMEGLLLMLSCFLSTSYSRLEDMDDECILDDARLNRPLLSRGATSFKEAGAGPSRLGRPSTDRRDEAEWRTRMKDQYGLDTNKFTYTPGVVHDYTAAPKLGSSTADGGNSSKSSCVIA